MSITEHLIPGPEKLDQKAEVNFKVGDRAWYMGKEFPEHYGRLGTITNIPNTAIAWLDFGVPNEEYGFKLTDLALEVEQNNKPESVTDMNQLKLRTDAKAFLQSIKKDDNKYDPSMLTLEMVELVSRVRMFGAKKYARNNFKITGFKYTRSCAAALRHIFAFLNGEDLDPESGLSHIGHAICSLEHLVYDLKNHTENDDRKS